MSSNKKSSSNKESSSPAEVVNELADVMQNRGISRVVYEAEGLKISMERECYQAVQPVQSIQPISAVPPVAASSANVPAQENVSTSQPNQNLEQENIEIVTSPMIGVIYLASAPDKPPFIQVGDKIKKDQDLFIIECMKTMNLVKSTYDGVVKEILVKNAQPVEYDQRLVVVSVE